MTRVLGVVVAIALGCSRPVDAPTSPGFEHALGARHVTSDRPPSLAPAGLPPQADRARIRFRMRQRFEDLRQIERMLVAGRLDEARTLAFLLAQPAHTVELAAWSAEEDRVAEAARALSRAASVEEACRLEARVGEACAGCHERVGARLSFAAVPRPFVRATAGTACTARQRWAADRMAEGFIGAATGSWRAGIEVFAATELSAPIDHAGRRLQVLARDALDDLARDTLADRARTYGELLATCGGCHTAARVAVARF